MTVARLNGRNFTHASHTPGPDSSDSDGVVLALETARALEAQGDFVEAARWLRRAADEAEKQGNDLRVLAFAHAAADLTKAHGHAPLADAATLPFVRHSEDFDSSEPTIRQPVALDPTSPDSDSSLVTDAECDAVPAIPSPASPPSVAPTISFICQLSISPDQPLTERAMRIGAIRVALRRPTRDARTFSVERLDNGQRLPDGTIEAMLVLAGEIDGASDVELDPPVVERGRKTKR
jgi:hypothetical protein